MQYGYAYASHIVPTGLTHHVVDIALFLFNLCKVIEVYICIIIVVLYL